MENITNIALRLRTAWGAVTRGAAEDERGDVPGWVLITLMTAGLQEVTYIDVC